MTKHENDRRVTRALWALRAYLEAAHSPPVSPQIVRKKQDIDHVSDLLTDLMHYCHGGPFSFDECLKTARINFEKEKHDEPA